METYAAIRRAIISKEQILAVYEGRYREMCPHAIGWKSGEAHALFYQFGGESSRPLGPVGSPDNWRCLRVGELSNVRTRKGPWHTSHRHSEAQTCIDKVDIEVT